MSRRPIELHPDAIEEARAARMWYEQRSAEVADAFMAELDNAVDEITEHPEKWATYMHGTRRYLLTRFPYLVIYRETEAVTHIIAVAHGHRRPGYWRSRVPAD